MALYQETKIRPIIEQQANQMSEENPILVTEETRIDRLSTAEVQQELGSFLQTRLQDQETREHVFGILNTVQEQSLHLENPNTREKTPINVSLEPIVLAQNTEEKLRNFVAATNVVRSAVLIKLSRDEHLRAFFESGVDPLAAEIMRGTDYTPMNAQWRFRADTASQPDGSTMYAIENNGGEPQGDGIISDAQKVVEKVLEVCLDVPEDQEVRLSQYPNEQLMKVMKARYRLATGKTDQPTIGYFAWRGRSSLSEAEARYTAQRYQELHPGTESIQFDPRDITDIKEVAPEGKDPYYVIVCQKPGTQETIEVDMVRRLHGEPMENMDLWREFKDTYGQKPCSDNEQETIWERFTTKLAPQMINPLNSYATDKKLDALLGNEALLNHFGIWEEVDDMLKDQKMQKDLSIPKQMIREGQPVAMTRENIQRVVKDTYPKTYMLRRQEDGLYENDTMGNEVCLTNEEVDLIKSTRENWVLKRSSLVGHSGTSVHVGRSVRLQELDFADYAALDEQSVESATNQTKEDFLRRLQNADEKEEKAIRAEISKNVAEMSKEQRSTLQDNAWEVLIENSLSAPDCLVQQAVPQVDVAVALFDVNNSEDGPNDLHFTTMHYDLDPQSIGPGTYTYPVIRVTSAEKTNITGGYGALGVPISESMAKSMLKYAKAKNLY